MSEGDGVAKHFEMWRDRDVSGVSGEGLVAEGWQYDVPMDLRLPDGMLLSMGPGWCRIHWHGEHQSMVLWPSFESAEAVHGHGGATRFVWTGRTTTIVPFVAGEQAVDLYFSDLTFTPDRIRKLAGE